MRRNGTSRRRRGATKRRGYSKRGYSRKLRIYKQFTRYDGVSPVKLAITADLSANNQNPNLTSFIIGWAGNVISPNALQMSDAPEWNATSALFDMVKVVGFSVVVQPVSTENQPGSRTIRQVHVGSFPNATTAGLVAAVPNIQQLSQRLDYKTYNGNRVQIKRYYKVAKALKNAIRQEGMSPSGYHAVVHGGVVQRQVDMGGTVVTLETQNFAANDYLAKVTVVYYVHFKDRVSL